MTNLFTKIWSDKWLRALSICGILLVIIGLFLPQWKMDNHEGFFIQSIKTLGYSRLTIWEIVSMVWSFFFAFYYFHHINKMGAKANTTFEGFLAGSIVLLPLFSIWFILIHNTFYHLILEYLIILVFWKIDKNFSKKLLENDDDKIDFILITHVLNTPLLFCFTIVFCWYTVINFLVEPANMLPYKDFISGFSATIFIIINVIFIVIQSGIVRELYKCKQLKEKCIHCTLKPETASDKDF